MSEGVRHFIEYPLQSIVLAWMAALYAIKIRQLSRLPMPAEVGPPKGSARSGALRSYATLVSPWSMESTRRNPGRWAEFWLYHLGVAAALTATFTLPFAPGFMTDGVRTGFAALILPALAVGVVKLARRLTRPELRLVSTLDDYFALVTMEVFFGTGVLALLTDRAGWRTTWFLVTAALIAYVPFSKISHYVYFFFARWLVGRRYGHRGVLPREGG